MQLWPRIIADAVIYAPTYFAVYNSFNYITLYYSCGQLQGEKSVFAINT